MSEYNTSPNWRTFESDGSTWTFVMDWPDEWELSNVEKLNLSLVSRYKNYINDWHQSQASILLKIHEATQNGNNPVVCI